MNPTFEFLIATVPDPIDAHVGWQFDEFVESIQRAAEKTEYVLDRYSLPWQCDVNELGIHGASSPETRHPAENAGQLHESQPGVLLFRGIQDTDEPHLLVIFLVGETPTSGIHKDALQRALDQIDRFSSAESSARHYRLVGPTFSGSVPSLKLVIRNRLCAVPNAHLDIVSGSATLTENKELLEHVTCEDGHQVTTTFSATVAPDEALRCAMEHYLHDSSQNPTVAVLIEGTSAYGADTLRNSGAQEDCRAQGHTVRHWLRLPYPMNISQLRAAAAREEKDTRNVDSAPIRDAIDNSRRPAIEMSLKNVGDANDIPPTFHGEISNAEAELAISNTLASVSRNGVNYVGIIATDPRDLLFLARQVRKYAPDVRLFTFGSSAFFGYPEYQDDLEGMIVASTYTLWPEAQWITSSFKSGEMIQFSSDTLEGVYNATLAQLSETIDKSHRNPLLDYSTPLMDVSRPPIWISVVGHGGIWPLRLYTMDDLGLSNRIRQYLRDPPLEAPSSYRSNPALWVFRHRLFAGSVCVALWFGSILVVLGCSAVLHGAGTLRPFNLFRPLSDGDGRRVQGVYTLAFLAILFVVYLYVATTMRLILTIGRHLNVPPESPNGIFWLTVLVLPLFVIGWVMTRELLVILALKRPILRSWYIVALAPLIFSLLGLHLINKDPPYNVFNSFLLLDRSLTLASGISPLLPVLLLGTTWLILVRCHLRRVMLASHQKVHSPFFRSSSVTGAGLPELENAVLTALNAPFGRIRLIVAMLGALLLAIVLSSRFQTFETSCFRFVFGCAAIGAFCLTSLVLLHFIQTWHHFSRYLRRLALHPMVEAYGRLPKHPRAVGGYLGAPAPMATDLEIPMIYLSLLRGGVDGTCKGETAIIASGFVERHLADYDRRCTIFTEELERAAKMNEEDITSTETRQWIEGMASQLLSVLDGFWKDATKRPSADAGAARVAITEPTLQLFGEISSQDALGRWLRLAEDFLALQVVNFINFVFACLRNLLSAVILCFLLVVLAVTSYPFEPQKLLLTAPCAALIATVALSVVVFVQVDRAEVLSRLAGTPPNKVTLNQGLISSLILYAGIPLLTLVATAFPPLGDLFSLADPILKVFK
jgi:hypothetical protein